MLRNRVMLPRLISCLVMLVLIIRSGLAITVSDLKQRIAENVQSIMNLECVFTHTTNYSKPLRDGTRFTSSSLAIVKRGDAIRLSMSAERRGMRIRCDEAVLDGIKTILEQKELNGPVQKSAQISKADSSLWSIGYSSPFPEMQFTSPLSVGYYLFNHPLNHYDFFYTENEIEHSRVLMGYNEVYKIIFQGSELTDGKELAVLKAVAVADHLFYQKVLLWLDPAKGFLVVGRQYFFQPEGGKEEKLWKEIVVKNAEQINGVWMPTEFDIINYTHLVASDQMVGSIETVRVTSLKINEPISDEELQISLGRGTRVYDQTKNKRFTIE